MGASASTAKLGFLDLPKEIRSLIYAHIAGDQKEKHQNSFTTKQGYFSVNPYRSGISGTCHQVRHEYFNEVAFRYRVHFNFDARSMRYRSRDFTGLDRSLRISEEIITLIQGFRIELQPSLQQGFLTQPLDLRLKNTNDEMPKILAKMDRKLRFVDGTRIVAVSQAQTGPMPSASLASLAAEFFLYGPDPRVKHDPVTIDLAKERLYYTPLVSYLQKHWKISINWFCAIGEYRTTITLISRLKHMRDDKNIK